MVMIMNMKLATCNAITFPTFPAFNEMSIQ